MRVLVTIPSVGPEGGAEQSLLAVAPVLLAAGVQLHLAVFTDHQTSVPEFERMGVVVHDLSVARSPLLRARRLARVVRATRPDVVHAVLWEATLPAQLMAAVTRTPLLISWTVTPSTDRSSDELSSGRWKRRVVEWIDSILGRFSGAEYHAVTGGVSSSVGAALRVRPERIHVGERGRDLDEFDRPVDRDRVRRGLGLPDGARVVLAVGRQDHQKGYGTLLEAFDTMAGDLDAWLLIAGRAGSATPALESQRAALQHSGRVQFLGQRDDIPELLSIADLFVCSSWREGAGGAILEAMASRTPVLSVRLAGLEGVLADGVNARLVRRESLAEGMAELLSDLELAARLASRARRDVEQRFTVERSANRLIEIYRTVADSRR